MIRAIIFAAVLAPLVSHGQLVVGVTAQDAGTRARILATAKSQIGITEKTGNNDGRDIDKYLASVGLEGTGAPYCACFVRWVYDASGLRKAGPRSALAASWVQAPTWTAANGGRTPMSGDPWGLFWGGRIRHTGLVEIWGTKTVRTIEGNTAPSSETGDQANGDGVWRKFRLIRQIHSVRNWLD